ncbi:YbaB/EbfC family nucleoid-associated protein [Mucilaginibacter rubeus]|uniref:YbaB/EbfC family nucleoid-associated protein n=1 Tax=Mucilaginibacter rubeus TaxID=2027860 RepID=A0AAE6MH11_9SPHI|nr:MULTISPECIES: YbaB/EbfC family nucleoid-associated protein [Mucilaginibacter]QEM03066.1 YbaB/EbfC family nucleoid-associated protein [Mucilaginibacter rubeus]QEM15686.1 YbaB/EbfC family nucleoid-associated protein [Mucilaginibacter gossypii]QTE41579.1 YbaB/EbfC family nucleoid-associated protein [Mucilaginibacter rubeus]QTE48185.1 YbaB/EbfC family nucleoid-associated protein [Mucilaginibacter rubeus]QTE59575.1 YbaB/EbfC family nucleoid-associated protein [Mucilaginibacter rubeus]
MNENIQSIIAKIQNSVSETVISPNNEVSVTVNGNAQITELHINEELPAEKLEPILMQSINKCLITVSHTMQAKLLSLQNPVN